MAEHPVVKTIYAVLEKDVRINLHRFPIAIVMQNGDLILTGAMESVAAKKLALMIAAKSHGVDRIVDRLTVIPAESMGDAEIRDHVCKVLLGEPALERCAIQAVPAGPIETGGQIREPGATIFVAVSDGVVTLNGEVPSLTHKRLAGALAWWVPGTRDVVNGLEEVPPEADNDDELIDAVRLVLEKDPFVDAGTIRVSSKDWVVTLEGLVPTEAMKQMAERDTWTVLGVKEVISRIQISH